MEEQLDLLHKRNRDDSPVDSPEVKRLRENLLEDWDDDADICASTQYRLALDSYVKIFECEIAISPDDLASLGGDWRPELGYLLEASDEELGIPPPAMSPDGELVRVGHDSSGELECGAALDGWFNISYTDPVSGSDELLPAQ